jgi:hypothetical protein
MGATQLGLYNEALNIIGDELLASLSENREARRRLDNVWNNNFIRRVLEMGYWNFAMRTAQLEFNPAVETPFGYRYAFELPTDYVRTYKLSLDPYFSMPLNDFSIERGYIYTDTQSIYLSYVSDDASYGGDLALWTESFKTYVEHELAYRIIRKQTGDSVSKKELFALKRRLLIEAKSKDVLNEGTKFFPMGNWTRSRLGAYGSSRTNGTRGSFY